jgi:hypothetical protein
MINTGKTKFKQYSFGLIPLQQWLALPDLSGKHSDLRKHGALILTLNYLSQSNSFSGFHIVIVLG